ncbi:MAG: hypothetical protein ABR562_00610, partial [Thermoplasmatota archaeon]
CWMEQSGLAAQVRHLVLGGAYTHVQDGQVALEVAFDWDAPSTCLDHHPFAVILDAESGAVVESRLSSRFRECAPA